MPPELSLFPYLFYLSKIYELVDTLILVLKRKPIIFLHAYHHCLVIPYTWFWATSNQPWSPPARPLSALGWTFLCPQALGFCLCRACAIRTISAWKPCGEV
jgi:hypothetical protein